jgi:hypothetical protein
MAKCDKCGAKDLPEGFVTSGNAETDYWTFCKPCFAKYEKWNAKQWLKAKDDADITPI